MQPRAEASPSTSTKERRVQKIKHVLSAVSQAKWSSFNEFLLAFYTSEDSDVARQAGTCLGYKEGQSYAPERLLETWLMKTTGETNAHLKEVIVRKAGDILVRESDRALRDPELRLPSTETTIPRLTTDFGLNRLTAIYQTLLPCMWMLLVTLMTATNTYEQKFHREKLNKDARAAQVSLSNTYTDSRCKGQGTTDPGIKVAVVIISMLLYVRNRATNVFQVFMGIFLSSTGASRRVISTLNHMGLSISYSYVHCASDLEGLLKHYIRMIERPKTAWKASQKVRRSVLVTLSCRQPDSLRSSTITSTSPCERLRSAWTV